MANPTVTECNNSLAAADDYKQAVQDLLDLIQGGGQLPTQAQIDAKIQAAIDRYTTLSNRNNELVT